MRNLWANFSKTALGTGLSESDSLTYSQVRNYFNSDLGEACPVIIQADDVLNCEGVISLITNDTVFSIKKSIEGKVTIKASKSTNDPWKVETLGNVSSTINFLKNIDGYMIDQIEFRDFGIFQNNGNSVTTVLSDLIVNDEDDMESIFRDFMIVSQGHIDIAARANSIVRCYGYTLSGRKIYLVPSN